MACSGLYIPCDENSSIYVFDTIFADMGDDQSIQNSLSTFSSHMLNMIQILKHATQNSLILVDELGSGTDPLEGSFLAISLLEHFKTIGCLTIATTHYQELKQYAFLTDGFENASVEFDLSTLSPTYRLLLGVPGKSNAFEISKKLGLDESIISNAQKHMTSQQVTMENLLKTIYDDKIIIEKQKEEISQELERIKKLRNSLETKNEEVKQQEKEQIEKAKLEARNILLEAKEDANNILKQMKSSNNLKELETSRNTLNTKIKNIHLAAPSDDSKNTILPESLKPNMEVFVTTLNQNGIVLSHISKSNEVQVQVGNLKMNISVKNLKMPVPIPKKDTSSSANPLKSSSISKTRMVKTELNVIGLHVEEAILVVDKFLDDACLAKLQTVRIVHGKGTGKLRNGIHSFLKKHPHVSSFRLGTYGEGKTGVTVVALT